VSHGSLGILLCNRVLKGYSCVTWYLRDILLSDSYFRDTLVSHGLLKIFFWHICSTSAILLCHMVLQRYSCVTWYLRDTLVSHGTSAILLCPLVLLAHQTRNVTGLALLNTLPGASFADIFRFILVHNEY
jgi:hypothetical protein